MSGARNTILRLHYYYDVIFEVLCTIYFVDHVKRGFLWGALLVREKRTLLFLAFCEP